MMAFGYITATIQIVVSMVLIAQVIGAKRKLSRTAYSALYIGAATSFLALLVSLVIGMDLVAIERLGVLYSVSTALDTMSKLTLTYGVVVVLKSMPLENNVSS